jgi:hypothetical protein
MLALLPASQGALLPLEQGGRQCYLKLSEVMKEIGFRKVRSEPCVYIWEDSTGGKVVVPTYVDDCHIISKTKEGIQHLKAELRKRFKPRDLGLSSWFLGVDIKRDRSTHTITLSQRQYIVDILRDFGMEDCAPVKTPMVPGLRLEKPASPFSAEEVEFMKDKPYLLAIGKLTWLANGTKPDIAYAAGLLSTTVRGRISGLQSSTSFAISRAQWTTNSSMVPVLILLPLPLSQMPTLLSRQLGSCFSWVVVQFPGPQNCSPVLPARPLRQNSLLVSPAPGTWPSSGTSWRIWGTIPHYPRHWAWTISLLFV